jgi:hypothetical protein
LQKHGIERIGELETPRVRPWATVLSLATNRGPVWLKATGPGAVSEVWLYDILVRAAPARVLEPIASDPALGWILLPDGGPPLGERFGVEELAQAMTTALRAALDQDDAVDREWLHAPIETLASLLDESYVGGA